MPAIKDFEKRSNDILKTIEIEHPTFKVDLYDNGEIDGDTISVYLDKKLVLSSKGLSVSPLIVKFKIDDENAEHELVMVAENLGFTIRGSRKLARGFFIPDVTPADV